MAAGIKETLEKHIEERFANQCWLELCLSGKIEEFPYKADPTGDPEISTPFSSPNQSDETVTPRAGDLSPQYLVNIPMGCLPRRRHADSKVTRLFKMLRDQSFGMTGAKSASMVKKRLSVVLGINQIQSIDPALNRSFKNYISHLPGIDDVVNRIIGFFWKPKWKTDFGVRPEGEQQRNQWKKLQKRVYPLLKAFLLLKCLSPENAEKLRKEIEQPEGLHPSIAAQIPYQKIRETIKNSRSTRELIDRIKDAALDCPIYYATMDADFLGLRNDSGKGIFSRLDTLLARNALSIVSLGYSLDPREAPLLRLAVKMDMAVRSAMPMPYFPEPFTAYKVRYPREDSFLHKISFTGKGRALESRRFIQSGKKLLTDGASLIPDGGVVTTAPGRMKTEYNQKVTFLTPTILKRKKTLQALRSRVIQSHAFPKQWSDILYAGLPFSCSQVTDATTLMGHMFSVFDPISRMFARDRYTTTVFDEVMQNYLNPLTAAQQNLLRTARGKLFNLGMEKEMIDCVKNTAKKSGEAIHRLLSDTLQELEGS